MKSHLWFLLVILVLGVARTCHCMSLAAPAEIGRIGSLSLSGSTYVPTQWGLEDLP